MIQQAVYSVLSAATDLTDLVGGKIYPDVPTTDTQLPFVVYWASDSDPNPTLGGKSSLTKFTVQVECWAVTLSEVVTIQTAVDAALDCYRGGNISAAFAQSSDTNPEDTGFHGQQVFDVWLTTATVISSPTAAAKITTTGDTITMTACDHVLTLDCDGFPPIGTQFRKTAPDIGRGY